MPAIGMHESRSRTLLRLRRARPFLHPASSRRSQHLGQPPVARRQALLHAALQDGIARLPRFVEDRLRYRRLSAILGQDDCPDGLARVPGFIELLGGNEPLWRHDLAINAAHPHLCSVGVLPPHVTVLAAYLEIDFADWHRPARRPEYPLFHQLRLSEGIKQR